MSCKHDMFDNLDLSSTRVAMAWAISMFGHPVMVARKTIAIAMVTLLQCGQFRSTAPSMMDRMLTTMKAAVQHWPAPSATVPKIQTPELLQPTCTANAPRPIPELALPLQRLLAFLPSHWKPSKIHRIYRIRFTIHCFPLNFSARTCLGVMFNI